MFEKRYLVICKCTAEYQEAFHPLGIYKTIEDAEEAKSRWLLKNLYTKNVSYYITEMEMGI